MADTLLTEFQGACRAAHEQAQMLQDLYRHFAGEAGLATSIDVDERVRQLRSYQGILARKLDEQDLLPTRPDPEKEGLLGIMAEVKSAFSPAGRPAAADRLAAEETELLRLTDAVLEHHDDAATTDARERTREAIACLAPEPDTGK